MEALPPITSLSNSLVKEARARRHQNARAETGQFLVEGLHHIGEALESGWEVDALLYAPELLTSGFARDLIDRATRLPLRLQPVSAQVMESLSGKDSPQGILAIVRQRQTRLEELSNPKCLVALVSPQDPGNVGAILRTIDAVGADGLLLLDGGVDLYHPTAVRASMGTLFWRPVVQTSFENFVEWTRAHSMQLIGTSSRADVDYHTLIPHEPWVLIMGSEQKGLTPEQAAVCDVTISLPMRGRVSSLNLAVATGILLYILNA